MPDWQPVVAPDLCPACGAYWECEHKPKEVADEITSIHAERIESFFSNKNMFTRPLGPPLTGEEEGDAAPLEFIPPGDGLWRPGGSEIPDAS